jgi:type 1 fimbriae regulatory protein FimB
VRVRDSHLRWLFVTERNGQFTRQGIYYLVRRIRERAGLTPVHPHVLCHACGYALANKGHDLRTIQDYLGHRDPKHTAIYTRTAAKRFENLWH